MKVKVLFFGVLADISGTGIKIYSKVRSLEELKQMIWNEFPEFRHYKFMVSLNNEIIKTDSALNDGDEIALLPPFAGG